MGMMHPTPEVRPEQSLPPTPSARRGRISSLRRWLEPDGLTVRAERLIRISANLVGAGGAALFAWSTLQFYLQTHRLIGGAFFVEQMWVVRADLIRRPARTSSRHIGESIWR